MKKVLEIITRSDFTGAQKVVYTIVQGLKDKFKIEVAYGQGDGRLIKKLEELGVEHHFIEHLKREISFLDDLKALHEIYSLIKKRKYDVVHLHSSKAGILGRIAAKLARVSKVIYTIHGFWGIEQYAGLKRKILIMAERLAAKFTDKIVLPCEKEKERAKIYKIGKESQYVIIPNAVIPEKPYPKGTLRKELGIPDDVKIVGNVARLDRPKNPMRFLKVATEVLKKRDDVAFVWIGGSLVEDYYSKAVNEYVRTHSEIKRKVFLLGFREDAAKLMADFDVFLLTSDYESFGLVVLEALYAGVPVVSTKCGGPEDIIEDGKTGFLVNKNIEEIRDVLEYTLDNLNNLRFSVKRSSEKILERFSIKSFLEGYSRIYEE